MRRLKSDLIKEAVDHQSSEGSRSINTRMEGPWII